MKTDDILKAARDRINEAHTADLDNRDRAEQDFRFLIGEQWPEDVKAERDAENKPCLTINGLPQFVRQVTGQVRSMNPAIKVMAADGEASEETAEIYEGLIRQIEYKADATSIYEETAATAAACGMGYWRVRADYCEGATFDQELMVERIYNPFSVYFDPLAKDPTRKDARYCFVIEEVAKDDFRDNYPGATISDIVTETRGATFQWATTDTVTVAEYYWVEYTEKEIGLLRTGQVVERIIEGLDIVKRRKVKMPKIMWAKITNDEILEGPTEVPSPFIPVIAVTGEEWHVGETMYRSSVIRFAKDPQMLYNYARSAQAEVIALQPKAPYLLTAKQVEGHQAMWGTANTANRPYLVYNPDDAPPPMRVPPPIPSQALMTEIQLAAEDMKRTTGIYDASLGAQSNEQSGVAIRERKMEAQVNTSIYADNMVKAITQTGKVLCAMIPRVYDTQRVIRILGEEDQEKMVVINSLMMTEQGPQPYNDMSVGKYDVKIGVGPSYTTKRQEAAEGMTDFMQTIPQAAPMVADLVAAAQDWPDSDKIAERLRKMLPPGMVEDDENQQPDPAQMQAMQAQQMQQQQAMQQEQQAAQIAQAEAVAKKEKAEADARKARAEADKAEMEAQAMALQMNAGMMPRAPMGAPSPQGF